MSLVVATSSILSPFSILPHFGHRAPPLPEVRYYETFVVLCDRMPKR